MRSTAKGVNQGERICAQILRARGVKQGINAHKDAGLRTKQDMYSTATACVYMIIYVTPETLIKMSVKRGRICKTTYMGKISSGNFL